MPREWNPVYAILNDSVIQETNASRDYVARRLVANTTEARRQKSLKQYWSINLAGALLNSRQLQELRNLERRARGIIYPVLLRITEYCFFEEYDINNLNPIPQVIGTGDGVETDYQLIKSSDDQGITYSEAIRHPNYNYPEFDDISGRAWNFLPELAVFLDGVEATPETDWTVDRNTGIVTFDTAPSNDVEITVTGGFYWKMLMPPSIPVKPDAHLYEIRSGVVLDEPRDGGLVND